jgi:glycosyltransferase involved in cell wall biosynthesis
MKLLHIFHSLSPASGGPAEGVRQMAPHLAVLGVEISAASLDPPDAPWLKDHAFPTFGLGPALGTYGYRRGLPGRIRALAQQHDLVIIHDMWQYNAFATWRALRGTRIPYYVYPHGMLDPWFKHTYPLKHLKKWTYWPWAGYRVLRDAEAVLFTTEQERILARESFWLYQARERVVGYGTSAPTGDTNRQRQLFLDRFPELTGKRVLLFLSRIHPKKGIDLLIDAFAAVASTDPALHLVIAGPDQVGLQASLEQQAAKLGIANRILWPGMLSGDLKWGAYRTAELFCLPSHQENFGIVVAEALACSLPVAITKPVNISAEVEAAGAGIVHDDTTAGTTKALQTWLKLSAKDRQTMGQCGLQLFQDRFDFAALAKTLLPVLEASQANPREAAVQSIG